MLLLLLVQLAFQTLWNINIHTQENDSLQKYEWLQVISQVLKTPKFWSVWSLKFQKKCILFTRIFFINTILWIPDILKVYR